MDQATEATLDSLRPQAPGSVMDLVAAAGVDVSPWRVKKDGSPVKKPRANPNYCYEWAFGGGAEPSVFCVWHESLRIADGLIVYEDSLRESAKRLDPIATDGDREVDIQFRARSQAKRAHRFDELLRAAFLDRSPIRVLLLTGNRRAREAAGLESSRVQFRALDEESWYVHSYRDSDGQFCLVRGVPGPVGEHDFVDQFSLLDAPVRRETAGWAYHRSAEVRRAALVRAGGICECCGCKGFRMDSGAVFLETHHVIPLSEGGPDEIWNVVAICPNDHRRAHFGADRDSIRLDLAAHLGDAHPQARAAIEQLLSKIED